jgi:hypothetical protein
MSIGLPIVDCRLDWPLSIGLAIADWTGHCRLGTPIANEIANHQSPMKSPIVNPIDTPHSAMPNLQSAVGNLQ